MNKTILFLIIVAFIACSKKEKAEPSSSSANTVKAPEPAPLREVTPDHFKSAKEMFADFGDYTKPRGDVRISKDGKHPVIQILPFTSTGENNELRERMVKQAMLYAVYRVFLHTDAEKVTVTGKPLLGTIGSDAYSDLSSPSFKVIVTREKALENAKTQLGINSFAQIQGEGLEFWSDAFKNGYYDDRSPGLTAFFDGLQ